MFAQNTIESLEVSKCIMINAFWSYICVCFHGSNEVLLYINFRAVLPNEATVQYKTVEIPGAWINIKMTSYQYRKSHCGDKTILGPSYLHNGISHTGKTVPLYWFRAQAAIFHLTCLQTYPHLLQAITTHHPTLIKQIHWPNHTLLNPGQTYTQCLSQEFQLPWSDCQIEATRFAEREIYRRCYKYKPFWKIFNHSIHNAR